MKSTNENTCYARPISYDQNDICLFSYGSSNKTNYKLQFSGFYNNSVWSCCWSRNPL